MRLPVISSVALLALFLNACATSEPPSVVIALNPPAQQEIKELPFDSEDLTWLYKTTYGEGNDMDVDDAESAMWDFLNQLEGQINALYQLGRYFEIRQDAMLAVIPRLSENQGWNDTSISMATELISSMK